MKTHYIKNILMILSVVSFLTFAGFLASLPPLEEQEHSNKNAKIVVRLIVLSLGLSVAANICGEYENQKTTKDTNKRINYGRK